MTDVFDQARLLQGIKEANMSRLTKMGDAELLDLWKDGRMKGTDEYIRAVEYEVERRGLS